MKKTILSICMVMTIFGTLQVSQVSSDGLNVSNNTNKVNQTREYIVNI